MSDNKPTYTPIPTASLNALASTVSSINTNVRSIKNELLPPVKKAAQEARDGVLVLSEKVRNLESAPPPPHSCNEKDRQANQDKAIAESQVRLGTFGRFFWWAAGATLVIAGSMITFAIASRSAAIENATRIQGHTAEIARHERSIEAVQKAQQLDRETFMKSINELPRRVRDEARTAPDVEAMEDAASDLQLSDYEQRQLLRLLNRAKARKEKSNVGR